MDKQAEVRPHLDTKSMTSTKGPDNLFMPTFMKSPRINNQAPSFPSGGRRQSKERKIISRSTTFTKEKLKLAENAWRPDIFKTKKEKEEDEGASEFEELLRRFKSILNKLTPTNFQKLMNQTMQLPINSEERLKGVVDLVFEKAIMEPLFSQAYANMCRVMQSIEVKKADDGEPVQFRKLILIKCRKQFERDRRDEQIEKERQRIMTNTNGKEKEEALAELEYQQMIVKKQIIGNIRFIGELFKLQLLTEKITQNCIFLLLKAKDEVSLECMSTLVTTVGQSLDHVKGKALMDQFFHQIDKIIKEKKVSPRIRFMLQDLKDLRESNWKPRRNEAKPVMIDQIRKEAEQEKQRKEQEQLAARLAPRISKGPQRSMEKYQQEDGWNTSSGSSNSKVSQANRFQMFGEDKFSRSLLLPRDSDKSRSSSSSKRFRESDIDRTREIQDLLATIDEIERCIDSSELDMNQEKIIPPKAETRIANFQRELMLLFQKENLENNAVFDFIEESIQPELRKTKEFIRALVSAVCYGAVKGEGTNSRGDHELLKNRSVLMRRYTDGNTDLELQALYAVQHLNNSLENPPGLLRLYFDVLFDEDVISEETFYAWRDSKDPNEKNGKGIALKSVTSFYTWLEESDPPS